MEVLAPCSSATIFAPCCVQQLVNIPSFARDVSGRTDVLGAGRVVSTASWHSQGSERLRSGRKADVQSLGCLIMARRRRRVLANVVRAGDIEAEEIEYEDSDDEGLEASQAMIPYVGVPYTEVTFVMQKHCDFEQEFFVAGDSEIFGHWSLDLALKLKWNEGDIWMGKADLPTGPKYEFKYVLKGSGGEVEWQPGSNHVLDTSSGAATLVMNESWDTEPQVMAPASDGASKEEAEATVEQAASAAKEAASQGDQNWPGKAWTAILGSLGRKPAVEEGSKV